MITDDFRRALDAILEDLTPETGIAAVLYRHPFGRVYYPLLIHIPETFVNPLGIDPNERYYLFSTRLEEADLQKGQIEIKTDADADILVQHGKLGVCLFERSLLKVQFHTCPSIADQHVVIAIIGPADTWPARITPPGDGILRAVGRIVHAWARTNESLLTPVGLTGEEVLSQTRNILDDARSDPPFFPVLHSQLTAKSFSDVGASQRGSNPLSYNCAIWSRCEQLRRDYIDEMFIQAIQEDLFFHPIPAGAYPLADAIGGKDGICKDYVRKLAVSESGSVLCARFNVPNDLVSKATKDWSRPLCKSPDPSDWHLLRRGISKLIAGDDLSALITMWIGRIENGAVKYAFPVGFSPGKQQHRLAEIMTSPQLSHLRVKISSGRITIDVLRLDAEANDYWQQAHQTITQLANAAAEKLATFENSFPPPYTLDFQGGKNDRPLLIGCGNSSIEPLTIHIHDPAYTFYRLLCKAKETQAADGIVTHAELYIAGFKRSPKPKRKDASTNPQKRDEAENRGSANDATEKIEKLKEEVIALVDERIAQPLRDRGANVRIYKNLFDNARQKGWRLGEKATHKDLPPDGSMGGIQYEPWMTGETKRTSHRPRGNSAGRE